MLLCLASASPGRRKVLRGAGIDHDVLVSTIDEDKILESMSQASVSEKVLALARAKATDVAARGKTLVLGCDSMFFLDGQVLGKPHTEEVARQRLRDMAGRTGTLYTGHWLITPTLSLGGVSEAEVTVADMTDQEIEDYLATGEPLNVAGSFTIDGFGGPFITSITGDPHGVTGLSLPLFRSLLAETGHSITELWRSDTSPEIR